MSNENLPAIRLAARTLILLWVFFLAPRALHAQSVFYDGFEGATLNAFWTFWTGGAGSVLLDNGAVHNGTQSVQLQSSAYGVNSDIFHSFQSPVYGTVDVYVDDPLIPNIGYKQLWLVNGPTPYDPSSPANSFIFIFYDWGNRNTYVEFSSPTGVLLAPAYASSGWRRWTVTTAPSGISIQIDGNTVFTSPVGFAFNSIALGQCCLAGYANFDDFSFTQTPAFQLTQLYDSSRPVRSGSTIPIKLELTDDSGNDLSSPSITLHAISVTKTSPSAAADVQDAGNANPDNDFRYRLRWEAREGTSSI